MNMKLTNQYPSLGNKVVFITGGATGIGACLVEAFCRQNAKVAFVDIEDDAAQNLVVRTGNDGQSTKPLFIHCDIRNVEKLKSAIADVRKMLGPVNVLVNNAANDTRHDFKTVSEEYWNERISVNLRPSFFAIQAVYEDMKQLGGGSIINFGSMSWYECQGNMTGYTTAKAGLEGMTRGLARDLGADNIRINTLVPGWVMTDRQLRDWVDEKSKAEINHNQCLKKPLLPEDIAAMTLFLSSDDSNMCTAQNFVVDGGWI